MPSSRWKGNALACLSISLFTAFALMSRAGLTTGLTAKDIAALRFGVGGVLLLPIVVKHGLGGLRVLQAVELAALGGIGFAMLAYAGFALAPAAHGTVLIHGTLPLTTALLAFAFGDTRKATAGAPGLVLTAVAVLAMLLDRSTERSDPGHAGDICLLLASFCWSAYGIRVRRLGIPAIHAAAIVATVSAALYMPVYALMPGKALFDAAWPTLLVQAVVQGALIGAASIFVYTRAIAHLGATRMSHFVATVPAIATIGGWLFLGEQPGALGVAGPCLAVAGTVVGLRGSSVRD